MRVPKGRSSRAWAAMIVAVSSGLAMSFAFADDDPAAIAAARELAKEGVLLAEAGKCKEAVEKLAKAEALHHAPTILERLGECEVNLGKLVDGTEKLQRVVREPLGPSAPPAFVAAVERAKKVLAAATPKIAKLTIDVTSPPGVNALVRIDGENVPSTLYGLERPTDPGHHELDARADGWVTAKASVDLGEGASAKVALTLSEKSPDAVASVEPTATAVPTASASAPPYVPPPPPPASSEVASPSKLPAFVALGMGAAGLVVGTTFGLIALHHKSNLDGACDTNKKCPTSEQSDLDSARRDANVSTVGFGIAIVGGLVGGALLLFGPSSTTNANAPSSGYVAPTIGLGTVGLQGAF
jgi:hypothetical protein